MLVTGWLCVGGFVLVSDEAFNTSLFGVGAVVFGLFGASLLPFEEESWFVFAGFDVDE